MIQSCIYRSDVEFTNFSAIRESLEMSRTTNEFRLANRLFFFGGSGCSLKKEEADLDEVISVAEKETLDRDLLTSIVLWSRSACLVSSSRHISHSSRVLTLIPLPRRGLLGRLPVLNAAVGSFSSEGGSGNMAVDLRTGEPLFFDNLRFPVSGTLSIDAVVFVACVMVVSVGGVY